MANTTDEEAVLNDMLAHLTHVQVRLNDVVNMVHRRRFYSTHTPTNATIALVLQDLDKASAPLVSNMNDLYALGGV